MAPLICHMAAHPTATAATHQKTTSPVVIRLRRPPWGIAYGTPKPMRTADSTAPDGVSRILRLDFILSLPPVHQLGENSVS
jgi:hypothetical protein